MGIAPSSYKQGGGFLSGKDVTWTGYSFQRKTFSGVGSDGGDFTPQNIELRFRIDGADEDVKTWLSMGRAENWGNQSEDGLLLYTPDGQSLNTNSQLGTFLGSFLTAGAPADAFDADESPEYLSLKALVARRPRMRLSTPVNVEKTEKFGQQKNRKTGKSFDRRDLVVEKFYGYTANSKGTNGSEAGVTKAKAMGNVQEEAMKTLLAIAETSGGTIHKGKLPTKVTALLGSKHPQLSEIRQVVCSEAFLNSLNDGEVAIYDADSKTVSVL